MSRLPKSWGLKTKKRPDGKLDIIQKDDTGWESCVRTTDTSEITERDIADLHAADREAYPNREAAVKAQMRRLVGEKEHKLSADEYFHQAMTFDESDWIAAAEPAVRAGFERQGSTIGSTHAYRKGWEFAFGKGNQ